MKCPSCKKENSEGVKFCKYCGSPILGSFKTCGNGHNYEANLSKCPFCPSIEYEKTVMDAQGNEKTVMDNFVNSDRTVIDNSTPTLKGGNSNSMPQDSDKTIIFSHRTTGSSESSPKDISLSPQRKLVGWLVSYDIDPYGKDFRLFEGRSKIGKSNRNDIIINQPGASDEHAILLYRDGKFVIQDNLSTNGTIVNGVSIEEKVSLSNDDIIQIGTISLKLKII